MNETATPAGDTAGTVRSIARGELDLDDLFTALGKGPRRTLVEVLSDREGAEVEELADAVAEQELDPIHTEEEVEQLTASLVHVHLPKLEDYEIVEFERNVLRVRTGENHEHALRLLRAVREVEG